MEQLDGNLALTRLVACAKHRSTAALSDASEKRVGVTDLCTDARVPHAHTGDLVGVFRVEPGVGCR